MAFGVFVFREKSLCNNLLTYGVLSEASVGLANPVLN